MKRILVVLSSLCFVAVSGFSSGITARPTIAIAAPARVVVPNNRPSLVSMAAASNDGDDETGLSVAESDQLVFGIAGTFAALVTLYSEFTLKTTGCGLPAGPFGVVSLVEGLSYLGVGGIGVFSIVTKAKTGSGLPAGPGGLVGAAEGLSFLAILVGAVVLALQITNYGYIPNAIPMEGGMCS